MTSVEVLEPEENVHVVQILDPSESRKRRREEDDEVDEQYNDESVAVQPVAVQPVAVQPTAPQPMPVQPVPVQPITIQTVPIQTVPIQPEPVRKVVWTNTPPPHSRPGGTSVRKCSSLFNSLLSVVVFAQQTSLVLLSRSTILPFVCLILMQRWWRMQVE